MPINKTVPTEYGAFADYFKIGMAIDSLNRVVTIEAYGYLSSAAYANSSKPIIILRIQAKNYQTQEQTSTPSKGLDADNNEIDINIAGTKIINHTDYDDLLAAIEESGWQSACENYLLTQPQFQGATIITQRRHCVAVKHKKHNNIPDLTQDNINILISIGLLPPGTTPADMTQSSDWNADHDVTGIVDASPVMAIPGGATILPSASGSRISNEGATSLSVYTLPIADNTMNFRFYVENAHGIQINFAGTNTGNNGGDVTSPGGSLKSTLVGSVIDFSGINANEYFVNAATGVWQSA